MDLIYLLGTIAFYGLIVLGIFLTLGTIWIVVFLKTSKAYFPRLMLLLIQGLESPLKAIFNFFKLDIKEIETTLIHLRNKLSRVEFSKVPYPERMLFLPQCLRNVKCPAKLGRDGIECIMCKRKCNVKEIKKEAEKIGYKVFIATGGSLIERVAKKYRPKAIFGVACRSEVKLGLDLVNKFNIPSQGVVLLREGCVNTVVDVDEVIRTMKRITPMPVSKAGVA